MLIFSCSYTYLQLLCLSPEPANEILKGIATLRRNEGKLKVPLAIAHSLHDEVCDPSGSKALYESLNMPGKKLYLYDDIKVHELLSPQTCEVRDARLWIPTGVLPGVARN